MSQATVTAYAGPGLLASGLVIANITKIDFDLIAGTLSLTVEGIVKVFALTGSNTITLTASGGNYTLSVS